MTFSQHLKKQIAPYHLLNHPFYQAWNQGKLSVKTLQEYSEQYSHHVRRFPRYVSYTHAQSEDPKAQCLLFENLADEEGVNSKPHPELWADFARGLGVTDRQLSESLAKSAIKNVIDTFFSQCRSSYHQGLAALYAYEYQVPEIAQTKIDGLNQHYGISDAKSLAFFEVHKKADVYHRQACEELLDQIPKDQQTEASQAAIDGAKALWDFLTSMQEYQQHAS